MGEQVEIHIGSLIKAKVEERGLSISDFARVLHYERTNIYKIFKRQSIDVDLLIRISRVLEYDFLREVYLKHTPEPSCRTICSITLELDKEDLEILKRFIAFKKKRE